VICTDIVRRLTDLFKPVLLTNVISNYLSDIDRLKNSDFDQIKKYRDKAFRRLIQYAYNVPLYHDKYKKAGIHPNDFRGIQDIEKLPIINRADIINNFPSGVIAQDSKKDAILVNTSGSTRNPASFYMDQYTLMKSLIAYVRELRNYGIRWNKSRISIIANFYSQTAPTQYFMSGTDSTIKPFFSLKNIQQINADDDLKDIIKRIDVFKPELIVGFPGPLRHLYLLKEKGFGENINPKCIVSSGGLIDSYEKKRIGESFNTRVFDIYGSTEAGPIAFECNDGNLHINSDFVYLETIDRNDTLLEKGKTGRLVMTRIYGKGTPLIRYTGMGDIITLQNDTCSCGMQTELIKKIHGRIKESIVLPDGKVIFPDALNDVVGKVLFQLKTDKIDRIQIIQESLKKIEILVIIDKEKRDDDPTIEKLFDKLKIEYQKLFGSETEIEIKEVTKLISEDESGVITPGILSKIDVNKYL